MTDNISKITTLYNLLEYDFRKLAAAEIQLAKSLTDWVAKTSSPKLKFVMIKYLDLVKEHVQMMRLFLKTEKTNLRNTSNKIMNALIEETNNKLSSCTCNEVSDASMLASIQGINHFKIWMYGTAAAFAHSTGMERQAATLHAAEINERQIDERLSQLAEHEINLNA